MEGEEKIGLVLARASELLFKITDAVDRIGGREIVAEKDDDYDDAGGEDETSLLVIRDALKLLEKQLVSLQALHEQQRYETQAALAKIDHSRKMLLIKLEEYKGEDLEVIHETATFASESVEHDEGFFLPPYPSHIPDLFVVNDTYPTSHLRSKNKASQNGLEVDSTWENSKVMDESQMRRTAQNSIQNKPKGIRFVIGLIAKSAISIVGFVSLLTLAGFKPEIRKRDTALNLLELFRRTDCERQESVQCPPGKVLVIEDGKARCLVKERIEIPFGSDFNNPNINIGFG